MVQAVLSDIPLAQSPVSDQSVNDQAAATSSNPATSRADPSGSMDEVSDSSPGLLKFPPTSKRLILQISFVC